MMRSTRNLCGSRLVQFSAVAVCASFAAAASGALLEDFALYGDSYVRLGNFANVATGKIGGRATVRLESGGNVADGIVAGGSVLWGGPDVGSSTHPASIQAGGDVYYDGFGTLYGNLSAGGAIRPLSSVAGLKVNGNVTAGGQIVYNSFFSTITGSVQQNATPAPAATLPAMPAATPFSPGTTSITKGPFDDVVLQPGSYADISLFDSNSLSLRSGNYYLRTLTTSSFVDLKFDLTQGPINVYVSDLMSLEIVKDIYVNGTKTTGVTPPTDATLRSWASQITFEVKKDVHYGGPMLGTVFAPNGSIVVDTFGAIAGALIADSLDLAGANNATVLFAPSARLMAAATVRPGDFNADGFVNGSDLASWKTSFGASAGGADFLLWQRAAGSASAGVTQPVPEPASAMLAIGGLALVARRAAGRRKSRGSARGRGTAPLAKSALFGLNFR